MPDNVPRLKVDDAKFNFRNFSGRNSRFASADIRRNFGVILDEETAQKLKSEGWPVKWPDPRVDGEERDPYLAVHVGYKIRAPRIVMITSTGMTALDESTVEVMDWAEIQTAKFICDLRPWTMQETGKSGMKAWLKTFVAIIEEDELEIEFGLNTNIPGLALPDDINLEDMS